VIRGDVGDQSVFEGNFLDFARHVPQIYQQAIHLCHPHQRILLDQARKRPLRIKRLGPRRPFDDARHGMNSALADFENAIGLAACECIGRDAARSARAAGAGAFTANGDAINGDPAHPSEIVEFTPAGIFAEAFKRPAEVPAIAYATIAESAAENFVALTRRAGAVLLLVRHIYLHVIREHYDAADVATLVGEIMPVNARKASL
jgi:hypothetical protein